MNESKFLIQGLGGDRVLQGEVSISGAKNAIIKAIASSILFDGAVEYSNVPCIEDVKRMFELMRLLGAEVNYNEEECNARIDTTRVKSDCIDPDIAKRLRSSIVITGPLLARFGEVIFPHPGGCVIGARPIDFFLNAYKKMGADINEQEGQYIIKSPTGGLKAVEIFFKAPSHTATETIMMSAVITHGVTVLQNVAMEPEIVHLAEFLNSAGAHIQGAGTPTITIEGTGGSMLHATDTYHTLPDRIEAGSFLILGALLGKNVKINNCNPEHLKALIELLRESGVRIKVQDDSISVINFREHKIFRSVDFKTHEYPGFPTDLQAPMVVYLTQAKGEGVVFETIFESRLNYVDDLITMGADIVMWDAQRIMVRGKTPLKGKVLVGPDIRTGFAFIIAGLVARGESTIENIYYIDRGYEKIEKKLKSLGANIERIKE